MIKCPNCGGDVDALGDNKYRCKYCANTFTVSTQTKSDSSIARTNTIDGVTQKEKKKALAPCPRCNSWNTNVENGIFYCEDCGFEGG